LYFMWVIMQKHWNCSNVGWDHSLLEARDKHEKAKDVGPDPMSFCFKKG
jgi:hypothetical protein